VATERSLYDRVGGMEFFGRLVDHFYDIGVAHDPVLLALYPDPADLTPAKERLRLFLAQYWGGPTTYSDERGHPRLRMRHGPFAIGPIERDHWLAAMHAAVKSTGVAGMEFEALLSYFNPAAEAMRNRD
jgi:hemoglobin